MSIVADTKAFLAGRAAISAVVSTRVSYNRVPMGYDGPFLWFARRTIDRSEDTTDEAVGSRPFRVLFDVEAVSMDGEDCDTLGDALAALSNYRGAYGNSSTVQAIVVQEHSDEYVPRGKDADEDLEVAAFQLEVVGYEPSA